MRCLSLTFTRNIRRDDPPIAQPHPRRLTLPGVGLLRLRDARLETHALHLRPVDQRGRARLARSLLHPASAPDLVEGRLRARGAGEVSFCQRRGGDCGRRGAEDGGESRGGGRCGRRGRSEDGGGDGRIGARRLVLLDNAPHAAEQQGGEGWRHWDSRCGLID